MGSAVPRVSVLMTVFNTRVYLREAINSVLQQTLSDLELIIIDDCSTDDSWSIIVDAAARDRRVLPLRRERQGGASAGLNDGLAHTRGEYITRQDSDDLSLPERLAEQTSFLERNPEVGAVGTAAVTIDSEGRPLGAFSVPETDEDIQATLLDHMCFCGPIVMVRRRVFEKVGLSFDGSLSGSEDYDLCLRLAEVTSLANLRRPLYLYRQHASSVSHSQGYDQLRRKASALEKAVYRRFGKAPSSSRFGNVCRDYLRAAVIGHAMGQPAGARDCVARAMALDSRILEKEELVDKIIRNCSPESPVPVALKFAHSLFDDVLPRTRGLTRVRRRLVAEIHLRAVFSATTQDEIDQIRPHLWAAIRSNPAWLTNRGILSLLVKRPLAGRGLTIRPNRGLKARTPSS